MGLISTIEQRENRKTFDMPPKPTPPDAASASPDAAPCCAICGAYDLWIDVYGGGPHCIACSPPPAPSFIRERLRGPPGSTREPSVQLTEVDLDREFQRHWIVHEYERKIGVDNFGAPMVEKRWTIQRRDFKWTEPCG